MTLHEGFAAVVGLRNTALEDLARVLYHAGQVQRVLDATVPPVGTTPAVRFDNLVMDPPTFLFRRPVAPVTPAGTVRMGIGIRARGPVTVQAQNRQPETHDSVVEATLIVRTRAILVGGRLGIITDMATLDLATILVTPFEGSSFSLDNRVELRRDDLREVIEFGLRLQLGGQPQLFPPFDISFLGPVATAAGTSAKLAVDDDRLLLGIDVNIPAAGIHPAVVTAGDATRLRDVCGSSDLALVTNPLALSTSFAAVEAGVSAMATAQGANLTAFDVGVVAGHIPISGTVAHDAGTVTFSMKAVPSIGSGPDPASRRLWVSLQDVVVTVSPAWWAVLAQILTVGLLSPIVDFFVTFVRSNIVNGVITRPPTSPGTVRRAFSLPGVTDPTIAMEVNRFECHDDGLVVGLTIGPEFRAAKLTGPTQLAVEELATVHSNPVRYAVDLGHEGITDDRYLHIRWEVHGTNGTRYLVRDGRVRDVGLVLELVYITLPWLQQPTYRISCRVYRTRGYVTEELLNETRSLSVVDRLDRSHPYVRWVHQAQVPMITVQADGSRTDLGTRVVTRRSKLHRTAFPGRCRFASHYSQEWLFAPTSIQGPVLEYLDDLPFPRADLPAHRGQVCDYCFFGGPTKTVPLIP